MTQPWAFVGWAGNPAIEAHGSFPDNPWQAGLLGFGESANEVGGIGGENAGGHFDARALKDRVGGSGMGRVGVGDGVNDPVKASFDDGIGACGSAAASGAWFEGDVEGGADGGIGAVSTMGGGDCFAFGVGLACAVVPAAAEFAIMFDDDSANGWVGAGATDTPGGLVEGDLHPCFV